MPELPEVETIRRSLVPVVLHKPIEAAEIHYAGIVRQMGVEALQAALVGNQFVDLSRRGKYLLFQLADHRELVAHLRMTGRLIYFSDRKIPPRAKHTSAVFDFGGQGQLRLEDVRKFATLDLVPRGNYEQIKGLFNLGVEPLSAEFSLQLFRELLQGRTAKIKGLLLDQSKLAGLGNIYADESLFAAGIHPERPAGSLTKKRRAAPVRVNPRCAYGSNCQPGHNISRLSHRVRAGGFVPKQTAHLRQKGNYAPPLPNRG